MDIFCLSWHFAYQDCGWITCRLFSALYLNLKVLTQVATEYDLCILAELFNFCRDIMFLFDAGQSAHADTFLSRVTDNHFFQFFNQATLYGVQKFSRNERTTNCGTFLSGFRGHFTEDFTDK